MKTIFYLLSFLFFMKTAFAQNNNTIPGVSEIVAPNYISIRLIIGAPQTILFITDKFCEPIVSLVLDSVGFVFSRDECPNGPCTVYYVYFKNKQMIVQESETLFYPQKPESK